MHGQQKSQYLCNSHTFILTFSCVTQEVSDSDEPFDEVYYMLEESVPYSSEVVNHMFL